MPKWAKNCLPWYSNRSTSVGPPSFRDRCGARAGGEIRSPRRRRNDTTMSEPSSQPSVMRVAVLATLGVLLAGGLLAGGIAWSLTRYGGGSACPAPAAATERGQIDTGTTTTFATEGPEQTGNGWVVVGDVADMR